MKLGQVGGTRASMSPMAPTTRTYPCSTREPLCRGLGAELSRDRRAGALRVGRVDADTVVEVAHVPRRRTLRCRDAMHDLLSVPHENLASPRFTGHAALMLKAVTPSRSKLTGGTRDLWGPIIACSMRHLSSTSLADSERNASSRKAARPTR